MYSRSAPGRGDVQRIQLAHQALVRTVGSVVVALVRTVIHIELGEFLQPSHRNSEFLQPQSQKHRSLEVGKLTTSESLSSDRSYRSSGHAEPDMNHLTNAPIISC